ncbi:MAG: hypothetical protein PHR15_08300 [Atopobiaceae bacterium]|jgi:Tfp pilus assembly protein PilX|nr:hypothetical protein [Atopobiaceae bacterium]MCH4230545.1 hypothetical protein [Atopobiaceae bacterium]MCI1226986.1 hypothetical protein [Atopobiaceae bacterium]MCI1260376.1 hypothetical protein [Atopobiaceae bacterium]MDD4381455.1 hypothetical protein [Atopobiaceae bacterium]
MRLHDIHARVGRRLADERGASIIIALVFMLICTMIAAVIVNLASATAERSSQRSDDTQAYQAVSSASRLAHDTFVKATGSTTAIDPDLSTLEMSVAQDGTCTFTCGEGTSKVPCTGTESDATKKVELLASAVKLNTSGAGTDGSIYLDVTGTNPNSGEALPTARVTYRMDERYNITLSTALVDTSDYAYSLSQTISATSETGITVDPATGTWSVISYPYTVTWGVTS